MLDEEYDRRAFCACLGEAVFAALEAFDMAQIDHEVNSRALRTVQRIGAVLEDKTLEDADCLTYIRAIIQAYQREMGYNLNIRRTLTEEERGMLEDLEYSGM